MLGVCVCVCMCVRQAATARRISLGGEGNALYPVLSSLEYFLNPYWLIWLCFLWQRRQP